MMYGIVRSLQGTGAMAIIEIGKWEIVDKQLLPMIVVYHVQY